MLEIVFSAVSCIFLNICQFPYFIPKRYMKCTLIVLLTVILTFIIPTKLFSTVISIFLNTDRIINIEKGGNNGNIEGIRFLFAFKWIFFTINSLEGCQDNEVFLTRHRIY